MRPRRGSNGGSGVSRCRVLFPSYRFRLFTVLLPFFYRLFAVIDSICSGNGRSWNAHLLLWAFIRNKYVRILEEFEYCGAAWRPHLHEVATNYVRIVEIVFVDR